MNGKTLRRTMAIGIAALGFLGLVNPRASAGVTWVLRPVQVPYTYYVWETQTRYRTVRQPVTRTRYRWDRVEEVTYKTLRDWGRIEWTDEHGCKHVRYGWRSTRVPKKTYRWVRVPYEEVICEEVREPYTVRVRVARTGHREETRWVAVRTAAPSVTLSVGTDRRRPPARQPRPVKVVRPVYRAGHQSGKAVPSPTLRSKPRVIPKQSGGRSPHTVVASRGRR